MRCAKVRKQLDDYLDHLLSEEEGRDWESHIRGCSDCRERYRSAQKLRELLSVGKKMRVPQGYWTSFWPRLRTKLPERRSRATIFPIWKPVYAAAAAAVVVLAVYTGTVLRDGREVSDITAGGPTDYVVSQVVPAAGEDKPASDYVIGTGKKGSRDRNFVIASASLAGSPAADYYW